jgi:hypothetical protein
MTDETRDQTDIAARREHLMAQSRATARRLAEVQTHLAEVEDQVARTHEALARERGDPAYLERAAHARGAADQARRAAARERATGAES